MEYKENQLRERMQSLIHKEGLTPRAFALKIGKQPNNIYQTLNGERHFPRGFEDAVLKAFPKLNKDWLYFGEGTMYQDDETVKVLPIGTKPRLPRVLSEGHLSDYFMGEKRDLCMEKPIVTQFPDYDFSLFLKTDRMAPNYRRGDELFFKRTQIIEWGSCYLVDTAEGPKFKRIYEEKDSIKCVSYNREEYPDFSIPRNLIYAFYKCVGFLRIL